MLSLISKFYHVLRRLTSSAASARPVVIVIHPWKLAYFRIPKAANSSIKHVFSRALELPDLVGLSRTSDLYWMSQDPELVEMLSVREFVERGYEDDYFSFSVVRDPIDRVISCYKNKFLRNKELSQSLASRGFTDSMGFTDFVNHLCKIRDAEADVHLMSQSYILSCEGRIRPKIIIPIQALVGHWKTIQEHVKVTHGTILDDLPTINSTKKISEVIPLDRDSMTKLEARYKKDYAMLSFEQA